MEMVEIGLKLHGRIDHIARGPHHPLQATMCPVEKQDLEAGLTESVHGPCGHETDIESSISEARAFLESDPYVVRRVSTR